MPYSVLASAIHAKDPAGRIHAYYRGQIVDWLSDAQHAHFLSKGFVEELHAGRHEAPEAEPSTATDIEPAGADDAPAGGRPRQVAPKEVWVDYGVSLGHDRGALESMTKADVVAVLS